MATVLENERAFSCNIPIDADYFDVSGIVGAIPREATAIDSFGNDEQQSRLIKLQTLPPTGEQRLLASFQLHPQYCGVLTHFAQFTDLYARDASQILTPGFEWAILQNGKPLFPYIRLEMIVNPWGCNCLPVVVRLDENARLEFVIRNRSVSEPELKNYPIKVFAGRLMGRYWYNSSFGGR
jgi:hypothetical protein